MGTEKSTVLENIVKQSSDAIKPVQDLTSFLTSSSSNNLITQIKGYSTAKEASAATVAMTVKVSNTDSEPIPVKIQVYSDMISSLISSIETSYSNMKWESLVTALKDLPVTIDEAVVKNAMTSAIYGSGKGVTETSSLSGVLSSLKDSIEGTIEGGAIKTSSHTISARVENALSTIFY
jgi:hypothetical protein